MDVLLMSVCYAVLVMSSSMFDRSSRAVRDVAVHIAVGAAVFVVVLMLIYSRFRHIYREIRHLTAQDADTASASAVPTVDDDHDDHVDAKKVK